MKPSIKASDIDSNIYFFITTSSYQDTRNWGGEGCLIMKILYYNVTETIEACHCCHCGQPWPSVVSRMEQAASYMV